MRRPVSGDGGALMTGPFSSVVLEEHCHTIASAEPSARFALNSDGRRAMVNGPGHGFMTRPTALLATVSYAGIATVKTFTARSPHLNLFGPRQSHRHIFVLVKHARTHDGRRKPIRAVRNPAGKEALINHPTTTRMLLGPLLQTYFCSYLISQRDLSPRTIRSYRDTFRLFLRFLQRQHRIQLDAVCVDDLDAPRVLAFLKDLEKSRDNCPRSRNARLAAIRSFFRHVAATNPLLLSLAQRVLAIPMKRFDRNAVSHLTREQIRQSWTRPGTSTLAGQRDRLLLLLLYNTVHGCRRSPICRSRTCDWSRVQRPHSWQRPQKAVRAAVACNREAPSTVAWRNGNA